jgi:hypothetical protein
MKEHMDAARKMAVLAGNMAVLAGNMKGDEFAIAEAFANETLALYNLAVDDYNEHMREHGCGLVFSAANPVPGESASG